MSQSSDQESQAKSTRTCRGSHRASLGVEAELIWVDHSPDLPSLQASGFCLPPLDDEYPATSASCCPPGSWQVLQPLFLEVQALPCLFPGFGGGVSGPPQERVANLPVPLSSVSCPGWRESKAGFEGPCASHPKHTLSSQPNLGKRLPQYIPGG